MPVFYRLSGGGVDDWKTALACNRLVILLMCGASCVLIAVAHPLDATMFPGHIQGWTRRSRGSLWPAAWLRQAASRNSASIIAAERNWLCIAAVEAVVAIAIRLC